MHGYSQNIGLDPGLIKGQLKPEQIVLNASLIIHPGEQFSSEYQVILTGPFDSDFSHYILP
jgi:hypothetical protein